MKNKRILLSVAMVALFGAALPRQADAGVSFSYFYDNLDPYGEWVDVGDYGYCWRPTGVDADWRPYTDGYWVYTDAGWTWVSYEDFGSITYHYGRWTNVDDVGWVWVPDYQWGPAWVSWRHSDSYVGWAPLPPEAHFRTSIGFSVWVDRDYDIGPRYYSFCDVHHFGDPVLRNVIVPPAQNVTIINKTVNITNITVNKTVNNNTVVFNGGPDFNTMSRASARPIQALKLQRQTEVAAGAGRPHLAQAVGNSLVVAAPEVEKPTARIAPNKVARVIKQPKIEHGWAGVAPEQRQQIENKIKQETKGLKAESAPARPVNAAKVAAIVPATADPQGTPGGLKKAAGAAQQQPAAQPGVQNPAEGTAQVPPAAAPGRKGKGKLQQFAPGATPAQGTAGETATTPAGQGQGEAAAVPGKKGKHGNQGTAAQGVVPQQPAPGAAEQTPAQAATENPAAAAQGQQGRGKKGKHPGQNAAVQGQGEGSQQAAEAARAAQERQAEARQQRQAEAQQQQERAAEAARARQEQQAQARQQHQAEMQQQRAAGEAARARQEQQAEARQQHQAEMQQERAAEAGRARQEQQAAARQQMQQQAERPHQGGGRGQGQGENEKKKHNKDDQSQN